MVSIDRPAMGPREERDLESAVAGAEQARADLEFVAAMGGIELESMAAQEGVTAQEGAAAEGGEADE